MRFQAKSTVSEKSAAILVFILERSSMLTGVINGKGDYVQLFLYMRTRERDSIMNLSGRKKKEREVVELLIFLNGAREE